jgi:oligopeptide transport system permease protein
MFMGERLVLIAFTAVAVSSIVFLGVHQLPGNAFLSDRRIDPAALQAIMHHYHLDLPLWDQYKLFVAGIFHGNLGESLVNRGVSITPLLLREATVSLEVGAAAMVFTIGIGMVLGVVAAIKQNTWIDYVATATSVIGYSIPNFVIATLLVLIFAVYLYNWSGGAIYYDIGWNGTYGTLGQIWIPAFALGFPYASIVARLTRASMLEVLRPLTIGIITGSVVIENIFGIPGLGKEFVNSILSRDYNIVIGVFTFYALAIGLANLLVDFLYTAIDPRIRY